MTSKNDIFISSAAGMITGMGAWFTIPSVHQVMQIIITLLTALVTGFMAALGHSLFKYLKSKWRK